MTLIGERLLLLLLVLDLILMYIYIDRGEQQVAVSLCVVGVAGIAIMAAPTPSE